MYVKALPLSLGFVMVLGSLVSGCGGAEESGFVRPPLNNQTPPPRPPAGDSLIDDDDDDSIPDRATYVAFGLNQAQTIRFPDGFDGFCPDAEEVTWELNDTAASHFSLTNEDSCTPTLVRTGTWASDVEPQLVGSMRGIPNQTDKRILFRLIRRLLPEVQVPDNLGSTYVYDLVRGYHLNSTMSQYTGGANYNLQSNNFMRIFRYTSNSSTPHHARFADGSQTNTLDRATTRRFRMPFNIVDPTPEVGTLADASYSLSCSKPSGGASDAFSSANYCPFQIVTTAGGEVTVEFKGGTYGSSNTARFHITDGYSFMVSHASITREVVIRLNVTTPAGTTNVALGTLRVRIVDTSWSY
jgi:hypothetical protein